MTGFNSIDTQRLQGCGAFLRQAREQAGLSLQDVGNRLKVPLKVLQALEAEDWAQLGAPVFIRGQLRSYAKLLKVDVDGYLAQAQLETVRPSELVSRSYTPTSHRVFESAKRKAIYVVVTAIIATPIWMATRPHLGGGQQTTASLDVMPQGSAPASSNASNGATGAEVDRPSAAPAAPYVASLTPPISRSTPALSLNFTGDSWVQIIGADGRSLEQALLKAGDQRSYEAGQVGRVVLGNASAVEVQRGGSTVDLTPYQRANVARFTVSSDGSLLPVAD
ncbi:helix-turn-helix domain-containing protein [Pseudoxanthomonas indica]|uniref:Cytoskeleton protein RodZ n=1 Tax=Pseudoxanthomonas indica TaxID=428993 RepID=A0A1T5LYW2_9GAMM|nr:helix-turn-helix domain-containing protein [Pseudoxanthomonas indica]GGD42705.1 membrane protein [Pseudoxanthomonas indica]SKC81167.1 cytoskeleton protein RodZ [Pseudoxanthomonas indica]